MEAGAKGQLFGMVIKNLTIFTMPRWIVIKTSYFMRLPLSVFRDPLPKVLLEGLMGETPPRQTLVRSTVEFGSHALEFRNNFMNEENGSYYPLSLKAISVWRGDMCDFVQFCKMSLVFSFTMPQAQTPIKYRVFESFEDNAAQE